MLLRATFPAFLREKSSKEVFLPLFRPPARPLRHHRPRGHKVHLGETVLVSTAAAAAAVLLLLATGGGGGMGMVFGKIDSPQPSYAVLAAKAGEYEVRRYEPMMVAEVTGSAVSKSDFDSANFRVLAQYIGVFGTPRNRRRGESEAAGQKVEMTAPVLSSASHEPIAMTAPVLSKAPGDAGAGKRQFSLSFILPHKFTENTAPAPLDDRIALRSVPARTVAVQSFGGNCPEDECSRRAQALRSLIQRDGYRLHPSLQVRS